MSLSWRKILLLIGFFLTVLIVGYGLYFLFLRPAIPTTPPDGQVTPGTGGLPTAGTGGNIPVGGGTGGALVPGQPSGSEIPGPPTQPLRPEVSRVANGGLTQATSLTTSRAYLPTLSGNGQDAAFYDRATGLFYQITPSGKVSPLSNEVFFEVQNVSWAPDRQKAVLEYPDGANIVYNFTTGQQVTLPKHWKDFNFSPNSDQLVFKSIGNNPDNRWLAVASADGSKAIQLENLGNKDATVYPSWSPNNQVVAMYREEKSFDQQSLYFVGLNGENFPSVTVDGLGFNGQWSTQGDKLLYSVYSSATDYKPSLWIVNAQGDSIGQNKRSLNLNTWADKCVFGNNTTIYCATPTNLQTGAGIYRNDLDNSPTDIYKIDLDSGFRTRVAIPDQTVNIDNLIVSDSQRVLYFTDKATGQLYKIDLQ